MKTKLHFILCFILITLFTSCQNSDEPYVLDKGNNFQQSKTKEALIPFATVKVLDELSKNMNIINYKFARKAALIEMNEFSDEFNKVSASPKFNLSKYPVLVYDADGSPKFYEFIVLNSEKTPIATITTFAQKEVMDITACILPFIRDYDHPNSLTFSATYPYSSYDGTITKSSFNNEYSNLPNINSPHEIATFWQGIDSKIERIVKLDDKAFLNEYFIRTRSKTKTYTIPRFDNNKLKRTRFSGWCGPSAMAWTYRGFYSTYKGSYIPLHGENSTSDYNLFSKGSTNTSYYTRNCPIYKDFEREAKTTLSGPLKGATLPRNFDKAVAKLFPDYKIKRHTGTIKGAPRRAIKRGNPVYLVVVTTSPSMHYIIGFGTKDKYTWYGFHKNSWILVTDNGTNTSSHGYLPYYRNSHFFNFNNKYTHMGEFVHK